MQDAGVTRTELLLWQRWCDRRDQRAFRALVASHEAFVYDFARRLTGHAADAEDLTQEAFLELAEADRERPPAVGVRAFLGRRLVLGAKMLKRASLTRQRLEPKATTPAPVHAENAVENREAAGAALAKLDPESRQALVLRFLHGLSYAEVAHVLGVNEGAARVRVHRGLGKLKERFGSKASASVAGLALFLPIKSFAAPTTKAAVLLGGALVMSTAKKIGIAAIVLVLLGSGAALWRAAREDSTVPVRSDSVAATQLDPKQADSRAVEEEPADATRPEPLAVAAVPLDAPIPKGRGSVSGVLKFRDGSPASGYQVSLSGSPAKIVRTDAAGRFHLHDEWVDQRGLCFRGPRDYSLSIMSITLEEDKRVEVDVTIDRGFTVSAEVVRQEDGEPVSGARVYLRSDEPDQRQARWGWVKLGADGRLRFRHVLPGSYRIQVVECPGLEATSRTIEVSSDRSMRIEMKPARSLMVKFENLPAVWRGSSVSLMFNKIGGPFFSVDAPNTKLDAEDRLLVDAPQRGRYHVTFFPGDSGMPRLDFGEYVVSDAPLEPIVHRFPNGARVVGTVLLADGTPFANRTVNLVPAGARAKTDAQGRFEIPFAREGNSRILVWPRGGTYVWIGNVEIPATGSVRADVRIRGTATLTGEFDRTATRWGGTVELFRQGEKRFGVDRKIRFDFIEAGDYELRAWSVNAAQSSKPLFVEKGARIDLGEVKIARFVGYPVRITAPAGREIPRSFPVMYTSKKNVRSARIELEADGSGLLSKVPEGPGKLWFTLNGCKYVEVAVELRPGMDPIEIQLEKAPVKLDVAVRLEIDDGVAIPDLLQVVAEGRGDTALASAFLIFPGHRKVGRLQNLVPGSYTLQIRHKDWKPQLLDVEIRSNDQEPIRIRVEASE